MLSFPINKTLRWLKTPKQLAGSCCLYSFGRCQFYHIHWTGIQKVSTSYSNLFLL